MPGSNIKKSPHTALLVGLEGTVESELTSALQADGWKVVHKTGGRHDRKAGGHPDIVFCGHEKPVYRTALQEFAALPVVVVSRLPEVSDWLDALEDGAADYCAAPFEPTQLRWLLRTHVPDQQPRPSRRPAAVA